MFSMLQKKIYTIKKIHCNKINFNKKILCNNLTVKEVYIQREVKVVQGKVAKKVIKNH